MISRFFSNSLRTAFILSSNCPRYFVPATSEARSRVKTLLLNKALETLRCTMRNASPSAIADLPTPGSPIRIGLFFLRRLRICEILSSSFSRPTIGSSLFSSAAFVRSRPKLSSTGVFDLLSAVFLKFSIPPPSSGSSSCEPLDNSSLGS